MKEPSSEGASTRVAMVIKAPRKAVYQALVDRDCFGSASGAIPEMGSASHFIALSGVEQAKL